MKNPSIRFELEVKVITFDLDDTLWPVMPVIRRAEAIFFSWLCEHAPMVTRRYTPESLLASRMRFMHAASPSEKHDLTRLRRRWLEEIALETGANAEQLITQGFDVFWRARNEVEPFPDAESTLEKLANRFVLGAISNGNADVFRTPLGQYFSFSMPAAEAGVAKPERQIFEKAVQKAGTSPEAVLHIGDDPECDVFGAHAAGLQAAWYNPEGKKWDHKGPEPKWVFRNLADIPGNLP